MGLLSCLQGGWGVTPLTDKFRCEPLALPRNSGTGLRCVRAVLCFVVAWFWFCCFAFAVAFKARRRRNAAKSAYYCFRIHKVFLTLSAHNESMAATKPRRITPLMHRVV